MIFGVHCLHMYFISTKKIEKYHLSIGAIACIQKWGRRRNSNYTPNSQQNPFFWTTKGK